MFCDTYLGHSQCILCVQALLSNAFAWMRKASDDQLEGMVALLQKVLQLYAASTLSDPRAGEVERRLRSVLRALFALSLLLHGD